MLLIIKLLALKNVYILRIYRGGACTGGKFYCNFVLRICRSTQPRHRDDEGCIFCHFWGKNTYLQSGRTILLTHYNKKGYFCNSNHNN